MKSAKCLFFSLSAVMAFASAGARDITWPPAMTGTADTMAMRMAVISGLPDSVAVRNPMIFIDKIDEDEHDIYVQNRYMRTLSVRAMLLSADADLTGRGKAFAKVVLLNPEGKTVKTVTTNQSGFASFNITEMKIPDGIYRLRVDYGDKHTKNGTKPKTRYALRVSTRVSLPASAQKPGEINPMTPPPIPR